MAKNRVVSIPTFNPKDTLKSIRENSLNPVIQRVAQVETVIESEIVPAVKKGFVDARLDKTTSKIYLERAGKHDTPPLADTVIDLSSIVPAYAGINIKGYKNPGEAATDPGTGEELNTSKVKFHNATITKDATDEYTKVDFEWDKIVPKHQTKQKAKIDEADEFTYEKFIIKGDGNHIFKQDRDGNLELDIPKIPDAQTALVVKVPAEVDPVYKPFTKIKLTGNVGGSIITPDGELQIDMPAGTGKFNVGYFQGFYDSLGDLETLDPTTLKVDRSSAYVKQEIVGVEVYLLYMYKGESATNKWVVVTNKAPLIYDSQTPGTPNQGIISVKGNPDISVNDKGELDLDGLRNHDSAGANFLGIYKTIEEIQNLPNPVENKSFAMLSTSGSHGLLPYMYMDLPSKPGEFGWVLAPALGHLMDVEGATTETGYKPIYGIKARNKAWKVTSAGVLDIPEYPQGMINAAVVGTTSSTPSSRGDIRYLRYMGGIADVKLDVPQKIAIIQPAQRIIPEFDDKARADLNAEDYLGKIYYDKSTGKWMGMTSKNVAQGEQKWTPVIHKSMSEEVSDQSYRYPRKSPQALPNVVEGTEDSTRWLYSGTTWLEAGDKSIPEEIRSKCGGFIKTEVKDDPSFPTGLETRVQTFTADDGSGRTYARAYDRDKSAVSKTVWTDWVRTNYSIEDFKAHEIDPGAHSVTHRFYRTTMVDFVWSQGPSDGILDRTHVYTFTDSYGHSHKSDKPGSIPYGGNFRMGMSVHFEGYRETKRVLPKGSWVITLIKNSHATGAETIVGSWEYKHDSTTDKEFKHFQFMQENISFDTDDQVKVKMEWTGDEGDLTTAAPMLRIMGTRSMIILEDMNTVSGTLVGNALTKFLGRTLDRGNVATHTHFRGDDESEDKDVRTYAEKVDPHFVNMTKKQTIEGEVDVRV